MAEDFACVRPRPLSMARGQWGGRPCPPVILARVAAAREESRSFWLNYLPAAAKCRGFKGFSSRCPIFLQFWPFARTIRAIYSRAENGLG